MSGVTGGATPRLPQNTRTSFLGGTLGRKLGEWRIVLGLVLVDGAPGAQSEPLARMAHWAKSR